MKYTILFRLVPIVLLFVAATASYAQKPFPAEGVVKQTFTYAVKDSALQLDYYSPESMAGRKTPVVLFVFGGAFVGGNRDAAIYNRYFDTLLNCGYKVVSISYRLGMKGVNKVSVFNTRPLHHAITMAVEDLYDATNWLIRFSDSLGFDTSKIILSGSSAGAITVLEADFMKSNRKKEALVLPAGFNYAAVVAFSGAILSYDGKLKYKNPPAPALLFHGTTDRIVPYNKIRFFNKGFYGSSFVAKTYLRQNLPYTVFRVKDMGHEISVQPMNNQLPLILDFIRDHVMEKKQYQADILFKDPDEKPTITINANQMFDRLAQ